MTQINPPHYDVEERQRAMECAALCEKTVANWLRSAVAAGWREQEIALHLADAADGYVVYLAKKSTTRFKAANSNSK
ncbi:hypothetical protein [Rhizobium tumorigenes]|uniref:hypothetical protein n=1 Tax=Rhizobium tumorigenes TaxID=2041385 RepID=UPI00241C89E7|nr:hypothetical protein [Rhizobium tumorigenes]WFS03311.1 hypothetical protein PR016_22015 [Rhizobium tumorigenes]